MDIGYTVLLLTFEALLRHSTDKILPIK